MNQYQKNQIEIEALQNIIAKAESRLNSAPPGRLRISNSDNRILCYHCSEEYKDTHPQGKYIAKKDRELASQLAEKDYLQDVLAIAKPLLRNVRNCPTTSAEHAIGECYSNLNRYRQEMVNPIILPDNLYALQWSQELYRGNPYRTDALVFATERGEYVRSKSEKMIADKLFMLKIPYKYECPLQCNRGKVFYPDFTLLNVSERKVYYLEHLGMLDNPEYAQAAVEKLNEYASAGIIQGDSLLITWETQRSPLDIRNLEALLRQYILS